MNGSNIFRNLSASVGKSAGSAAVDVISELGTFSVTPVRGSDFWHGPYVEFDPERIRKIETYPAVSHAMIADGFRPSELGY